MILAQHCFIVKGEDGKKEGNKEENFSNRKVGKQKGLKWMRGKK